MSKSTIVLQRGISYKRIVLLELKGRAYFSQINLILDILSEIMS